MRRRTVLFYLLAAVIALYAAQGIGIRLYDTSSYELIFAPSHFLGGMCVAFGIIYIARLSSFRLMLPHCLFVVLIAGVAWEIWEYSWALPIPAWDTLTDIIMDLLGGYAAYRLAQTSQ